MKNIQEAVRKELELQQMLNGAIREKEVGLRQLQKILLHALNLVNGLLDEGPEAAQSLPQDASPGESPEPQAAATTEAAPPNRAAESEIEHDSARDIP